MTRLTLNPDGRSFTAATVHGPIEIRPSHADWRKRPAWWEARLGGRRIGRWTFTAAQAVAAAVRHFAGAGVP